MTGGDAEDTRPAAEGRARGQGGGSTQVHLGPGPAVDAVHALSLRAALLTGERPEITEPGESEDFGLLLETSEELIPAREFGRILRGLGERGLLGAVDAVLVARPPTSGFDVRPTPAERAARRAEQRDVAVDTVRRYNPDAVVVVGVPFGHTRPQWILPHGGTVVVDGDHQRLWADYS